MRAHEFITEEISQGELDKVELFADRLWGKFGIDVDFTKHFIERVNDLRNGKPITTSELVRIFRKEYERYGKTIAGMDGEAVMKDTGTDVNLPFAKHDNRLAAKTIMRKNNFKTPDPEYVVEVDVPKNRWETILSTADKNEVGDDLIRLVQTAYGNTEKGSFVNSIQDVLPSDWKVLDWDHKPDVDCAVFYRGPRGNEPWSGNKIQGLGHDGERGSKDHAIQQIAQLLGSGGWWIECNGAMRQVLRKLGVSFATNERALQSLFNDPELRMVSKDSYVRHLEDGTEIEESVAGKPSLKKQLSEKIKGADGKACWDGYRYAGTEKGKDKCVKVGEDWSKTNKKDRTDGMSQKAVNAYKRENPGSKLKTAVTKDPSKIKKGSKDAKRRKSYCSRSAGQQKMHNISCSKTPDKPICKARRRWNCESVEEMEQLLAQGRQFVAELKENFKDGRNPQDKGDSKRHGVPTKASVSSLRKIAKQGGRKGQLAHWMANMKAGRKKAAKKS